MTRLENRPARAQQALASENYLLLSDVHLGAGLVSHARPWADNWRQSYSEVDHQLTTFLDYYDRARPGGKPWRLVIAGDFVDFIGMSLPLPDEPLPSGITHEERAHGLGSAADHAVCKLQAAALLHQGAFAALARFLVSGNKLVIVRGNHDVDFHWKAVQRAFVDILHALGPAHVNRKFIKRRVLFCPWFFYVKDLLYVEHGHEFDPMCSYGDPLRPTCLRDPRRIRWTPSDVMMRYVARPTPGLSTSVHETGSIGSYFKLAVSLGFLGGIRLAARFARATLRLMTDCWLHSLAGKHLRTGRSQRLRKHVRRWPVSQHVHEALAALYTQPVLTQPLALARRLYLDSLLLIAVAALTAGVSLALPTESLGCALTGLCAIAALALAARTADRSEDAGESQQKGAARIAEVLPTKLVVMGHSHGPMSVPLGADQTYVNLGNWGQDDLPEDRPAGLSAPCTHLAVTQQSGKLVHQLRRWDAEQGRPLPFAAPRPKPAPKLSVEPLIQEVPKQTPPVAEAPARFAWTRGGLLSRRPET